MLLVFLLAALLSLGWSQFVLTGELQVWSSTDPGFSVASGTDTGYNFGPLDVYGRPTATGAVPSGFSNWWRSNANINNTYPYSLNFQTSGSVFQFDRPAANPFKPSAATSSLPPHTGATFRPFTLRVRGQAGAGGSWRARSTGDFALYNNGAVACSQAGIDTGRTATPVSCTVSTNAQIDIFVAHRATSPISLELFIEANAVASNAGASCSVAYQQSRVNGVYPFGLADLNTADGNTITLSPPVLTMVTPINFANYAWSKALIRPNNGFQTSFKFALRNTGAQSPEGFAFVIQARGPAASGDSGANLGYNFPNSLAVEFDTSSGSGDTLSGQHIDIRTGYTAINSASGTTNSLTVPAGGKAFTFAYYATYEVLIEYSPSGTNNFKVLISAANQTLSAGGTWASRTGSGNTETTATVPSASFNSIFGTSRVGYVGFTTSSGNANQNQLLISDWRVFQVPVAPLRTTAAATPTTYLTTDIARNAQNGAGIKISLFDACATSIPNGLESVVATLYDQVTPSSSMVMPVTNNNDGTYQVWYYYTKAQPLTDIQFFVQVAGEPSNLPVALSGREGYYPVKITPAPIAAFNCTAQFFNHWTGQIIPTITAFRWLANSSVDVVIQAKDQFGNNNTDDDRANFQVAFSNQAPFFATQAPVGNQYSVPSVTNTLANPGQVLFVKHKGSDINNGFPFSPINVLPDLLPDVVQSAITVGGNGLVFATVGQEAEATFSIKDHWNNQITTFTAGTTENPPFTLDADASLVCHTCVGTPLTQPTITKSNSPLPLFTLKYQTTIAGVYNLTIRITNAYPYPLPGTTQAFPVYQPNVAPGVESAKKSVLLPKAPYAVANIGFLSFQAADAFGNNRTQANQNGLFTVRLGNPGTTVDALCDNNLVGGSSEVKNVTCKYNSAGVFQVSFLPQLSEDLKVAVAQTSQSPTFYDIGSVFVQPGLPCPPCDVIALPALTIPYKIIAGHTGSYFTVTDYDVVGNKRLFSDDADLYLPKMVIPGNPTSDVVIGNGTVEPGAGNSHMGRFTFNGNTSGWYNLTVTLLGKSLQNSGIPVEIVPNYTHVNNCILQGPGLAGGTSGNQTSLTLQAVDAFLNKNNYSRPDTVNNNADTITCSITYNGAESTGPPACDAVFQSGGLWNINYRVPTPIVTGQTSFTLKITLIADKIAPTTQTRLITLPLSASGDENFAMLYEHYDDANCPATASFLGTMKAAQNNFLFLRHRGIIESCGDTARLLPAPTWLIKFDITGGASFTGNANGTNYTIPTPNPGVCTPRGGTTCYAEAVTFYAARVGTYDVTVFAGATQTEQSKGGPSAFNSQKLTIKIVPGWVYAPKSFVTGSLDGLDTIAGTQSTFQVTLSDAEGNLLTEPDNDNAVYVDSMKTPTVTGPATVGTTFTAAADPTMKHLVTMTITPTKAGDSNVQLQIPASKPPLVQSKGFKIRVTPAPLASACFVAKDSTICLDALTPNAVAGNLYTTYIMAKDQYDNNLIDPDIKFGVLLTSNDPVTVTTQYLKAGIYQITFTANIATTTLTALGEIIPTYGGQNYRKATITIDPADIDPAFSSVEGLNVNGTAGTQFDFTFVARDRFNNPWVFKPDAQASKVSVQLAGPLAVKQGSAGNSIILSNPTNPNGRFAYRWTYPQIATTYTGTNPSPFYYLTISCTGNGLGSVPVLYTASDTPPITGLIPFGVVAGPPYAVKTTFPYFSNKQIPAGSVSDYMISLSDQYGNKILKGGYHLTVDFYLLDGVPLCAGVKPDDSKKINQRFTTTPYWTDLNNGSFSIHIESKNATFYYAWVTVVEAVMSQNPSLGTEVAGCKECISTCQKNPNPFQIVPLEPNATISYLTNGAISYPNITIAGQPLTFDIVLLDKYYNPVGKGGWDLTVGDKTPNDYSADICGGDANRTLGNWLSLNPATELVDLGNGNYTAKWTATKARTVGAVVLINYGPSSPNNGMVSGIEWPNCHRITIKPWYVAYEDIYYYWNQTEVTRVTATEGLEDLIEIYGGDRFNNSVVYGDFYWTEYMNRDKSRGPNPATDPLAPYAFQRTSERPFADSAHQDVNYILHHPGVYEITNHFIQEDKYKDQTLFPLRDPRDKKLVITIEPRSCMGRQNAGITTNGPWTCPDETCAGSSTGCGVATAGSPTGNRGRPNGYIFCADGRTVVGKASQCPDGLPLSGAVATNHYGTEVTCATNGHLLCPDGSCQPSCDNVVVYSCLKALPKKCDDGTCRSKLNDCPTGITCQPGFPVRCNTGHCVKTVAECAGLEINNCTTLATHRCPDGTCKTNPLLCPTGVTCPASRPILCADRSCVSALGYCRKPITCDKMSSTPYPCFDGSCARNAAQCPTPPTCGFDLPVLCEDFSCAKKVEDCTSTVRGSNPPSGVCPAHRPFNCLDGTCASQLNACPTTVICGPDSPVKCATAACSVASNTCPLFNCLSGNVPCPGGGCATSYNECPTSITCPVDHVRCSDGSCRMNCANVTRDSSTFCKFPLMNCPTHESGFQCAVNGYDCALSPTCPPTRPVRCTDRSCAVSIEFCKPAPSYPDNFAKKTCASNTWADRDKDCSLSGGVTCPTNFPAKCWDDSCRVVSADCPLEPACAQDASNPNNIMPNVCGDGNCARTIFDCATVPPCSLDKPIRCGGFFSGQDRRDCVRTVSECHNLANLSLPLSCANKGTRCYDGSCRGTCPAIELKCPHYTPLLCDDGHCVGDWSECLNKDTGCPPDKANRCDDGSCAADCGGRSKPSCTTGVPCKDGSCRETCPSNLESSKNGCGAFLRCWDGSCETKKGECKSQTFDSSLINIPNACPLQHPYKCPNGLCSISSSACTVFPNAGCSGSKPISCADGTCVKTHEQCPAIKPCLSTETRCPNGQCAVDSKSCPLYKKCPGDQVMCDNGLCAVSLNDCLNRWTGCPNSTKKCPDGLCIAQSGTCSNPYPGTGCPAGQQKCYDGSCGSCSNPPPCNPADPAAGDCLRDAVTTTAWGCPATSPVRCYDGSCKANAADFEQSTTACTPGGGKSASYEQGMSAVVCPSTTPNVCRDGSCVGNPSHCPAFLECATGTLCLDMTCMGTCPALFCPAGSPVFCPDGSCRRTALECGNLPGANCSASEVRCFDGTCAAKPMACMEKASASQNTNVDSACPGGKLCWNGQCVRNDGYSEALLQTKYCPWVPSCPLNAPMRCWDGSCANETNTPCPAPNGACSAGNRCEDGSCRAKCLPFDGCPMSTPYLCAFSKDRCTKDQKTCDDIKEAQVCPGNCKKYLQVIPQTVSIPVATAVEVVLAKTMVTHSPTLWFKIPTGTFGGSTQLKVWPVPFEQLRGGVTKINGVFVDRTPEQIMLSPSLQFSVDGQTSGRAFPMNFTVKAVIDRNVYKSADVAQIVTSPCIWRGPYSAKFREVDGNPQCLGNLIIKDTAISFANSDEGAADCPKFSYAGTIQNSTVEQPDTSGAFYSCVCINVTESNSNDTNYMYNNGTTLCMSLQLNAQGARFVHIATTPSGVGQCQKAGGSVVSYSADLTDPSESKACTSGSAGLIPAQDICWGQFDPFVRPPQWTCVRASYVERIAHPTWVQSSGDLPTVVTGQVTQSRTGITYAILNIPLPPPEKKKDEGQSWWQKYGKIVLGVTISMFILLLILAYAISRLIRYREKYLVEKRDAAALREEAQELDEKHGGLGVYDEEVEMIANPLVVQMQELQKQLEQTNASLSTQEELDATQMAAMDKERQRILEEIKRVKDAIAAQKKNAPTAAYDAPATNPTQTSGTGTTSTQPATSERQEFVQSAPPRRKKNEF